MNLSATFLFARNVYYGLNTTSKVLIMTYMLKFQIKYKVSYYLLYKFFPFWTVPFNFSFQVHKKILFSKTDQGDLNNLFLFMAKASLSTSTHYELHLDALKFYQILLELIVLSIIGSKIQILRN